MILYENTIIAKKLQVFCALFKYKLSRICEVNLGKYMENIRFEVIFHFLPLKNPQTL